MAAANELAWREWAAGTLVSWWRARRARVAREAAENDHAWRVWAADTLGAWWRDAVAWRRYYAEQAAAERENRNAQPQRARKRLRGQS